MSKNLKTLHQQLRNQGYTLLTAMNNAYQPGMIVHEKSWKNIPLLGSIEGAMTKKTFPGLQGPKTVVLEEFTRKHELDVRAALDWIGDAATAKGQLKNVVQVSGRFEGPVSRWVDLVELSMAVGPQLEGNSVLKRYVRKPGHRLIAQIVEARLSFHFEKEGGIGLAVNGTIPGPSLAIKANAGYKWKNEATIETVKPIVVAMQLADWSPTQGIFIANH